MEPARLPGLRATRLGVVWPGTGRWSSWPTTSGRCWCSVPPRATLSTCRPRQMASNGRSLLEGAVAEGYFPSCRARGEAGPSGRAARPRTWPGPTSGPPVSTRRVQGREDGYGDPEGDGGQQHRVAPGPGHGGHVAVRAAGRPVRPRRQNALFRRRSTELSGAGTARPGQRRSKPRNRSQSVTVPL